MPMIYVRFEFETPVPWHCKEVCVWKMSIPHFAGCVLAYFTFWNKMCFFY